MRQSKRQIHLEKEMKGALGLGKIVPFCQQESWRGKEQKYKLTKVHSEVTCKNCISAARIPQSAFPTE